MIPKDKIGQDIIVGDSIAYGHALRRRAGIRIGKVLQIKGEIHTNLRNKEETRWRIHVWGVDDDYFPNMDLQILTHKGVLEFPTRIVKLGIEQVPPVYIELLKDVTMETKHHKRVYKWKDTTNDLV
jgi:hypothetical protein